MRLFLSVDMEGATGVCHRDHLVPGGQDYERARRWLTGDVNAAIDGALAAGATDFVVADGHGTMRNLVLEELHEAARYLTGPAQARNRPLGQLAALEDGPYGGAFLIGYHSRAGTPGGLLAHTWIGSVVGEIRLNGRPAGEALLNAAILGHFGIPVLFASGASDFCREARADLGADLPCAEVKRALGPTAALTLSPKRAGALLRAGAEQAVRRRAARAPLRIDPPVRVEVDLHRGEMRDRAHELGGEAIGARTLVHEGKDVLDVAKRVWRALEHTTREDSAWLK
jgi:D-amino peptidase